MDKFERCILTNMCMIYDGDKVLVQKRTKSWQGIAFPGGHVERNESLIESVTREVYEETGLTICSVELCGVKNVIARDIEGYDRYIVFLYKTNDFEGELIEQCEEGINYWAQRSELNVEDFADGFVEMLTVFENPTLSENYYHYDGESWVARNQ